MKNIYRFILFICLFISTNVLASFHCTVDVQRVLVYATGGINILHTGRGDYTNICNLNSTWKGVEPLTCAMWTSLLQNSQVNAQKVIFYYPGDGSCKELATYGNTPAPVYIGTIK